MYFITAVLLLVTATTAVAANTVAGVDASLKNSTYCYSVNNAYYEICTEKQQCCGSGTMQPQCIDPTVSQCCEWYLAATTCTKDQVCCGAGGPGASSGAQCCGAGTTCCSSYETMSMQCCTSSQKCGGTFDQPQCVAK